MEITKESNAIAFVNCIHSTTWFENVLVSGGNSMVLTLTPNLECKSMFSEDRMTQKCNHYRFEKKKR